MNHSRPIADDRLPAADPDQLPGAGAPATEPARIAEDIARTRQELGETLEELSARLDVKARARSGMAQAQHRAVELARPATRYARPAAIGLAAGAGLLAVLLLLRRRWNRR